jgi:hypothetical protein
MGYCTVNLKDMRMTDVPLEIIAVLKPKSNDLKDDARGHLTLYYTYTNAAYLQEQAELSKKAAEEEATLLADAPHYESTSIPTDLPLSFSLTHMELSVNS